MSVVIYSSAANADLRNILDFIAENNPERAISFIEELREACRWRAKFPNSGRRDSDLKPGVLWFAHAGYVFYYRVIAEESGIRVLRVFNSAQNHKVIIRTK